MTGLALRRAASMICFCRNGTSSSGHSTPRSPRATMTPSKARTISSRLSMACGFSILAMTGRCTPTSSMIARTSSTSAAERTNDSAMMSAVRPQRPAQVVLVLLAHRRHRDRDAGQVDALVVADACRPRSTRQRTSVPSTETTSRRTRPSSMRIWSPGDDVARQPGVRRADDVGVAGDVAGGDGELLARRRGRPGRTANLPSRILGPWRSTRIPTPRPVASEASRTIR